MLFNELNSVEYYIIKQLTGVNIDTNDVSDFKSLLKSLINQIF